MADETLDASGLNCPLPILKTKKALSKMGAGQVLEVISTDAGSVKDIEAFCNQTGNLFIHCDCSRCKNKRRKGPIKCSLRCNNCHFVIIRHDNLL